MLNMKKGCKIDHAEKLYAQYQKTEYGYMANVHAEKISDVLIHFLDMQAGLVFFILELPANQACERGGENFHKDIYYIDNLSREDAKILLERAGELLIHDGLCSFGFGSQMLHDEIMVGKYNVLTVNSPRKQQYDNIFTSCGIEKTDKLITAWDTFSKESPGISKRYQINGKDVYSILEDFKNWGIYFVEQREA